MKKIWPRIKDFFSVSVSRKLKQDFHAFSLDRTRVAFLVLAVLDFPIAVLEGLMDYNLVQSGSADPVYISSMIGTHIAIFLTSLLYVLYALLEKRVPLFRRGRRPAVIAYAVVFFGKAGVLTVLSQLYTGNVVFYSIILIGAIVVVMLEPKIVLPLYGLTGAVVITGIRIFQKDPALLWSNLLNVFVLTLAAPVMWYLFYRFRLQTFINRKELEQTREELAKSEEQFRSIVELAPEGIVISGLDGRLQYLSPAAYTIFGVRPGTDVIGDSLYHYVDPSMHEKVQGRVETMVRNKENQMVTDYKLVRVDGDVFDGEITSGPFRQQDGRVTGIISIIRDVNDRKLMERNLMDLNRLKDKIFQVISHDLRKPVADFKNLLHVLEYRGADYSEEKREKLYIDIRHTIGVTELLMENLFALGQKYSELTEPILEICSFLPFLLDLRDRFSVTFRKKGISMKIGAEEDVTVLIDSHMIMIVLWNLISNAIKYTMPGGEVTAGYTIEDNTIIVSVSDTGIGMSPEVIKTVREEAAGFTSHGTAGENGTGIGLSVCRYFLQKHDSNLSIESIRGKGTTVTFPLKRYRA